MDYKRFWPMLIPLVTMLIEAFSGQISDFLATHPNISLLVATVTTAIANLVRSPKQA